MATRTDGSRILSSEILSAIAQVIEEQVVPANHNLVLEDTPLKRFTFSNKASWKLSQQSNKLSLGF